MTRDRFVRCIVRLQNQLGIVVSSDRALMMAQELAQKRPRWTVQEATNAYYLIIDDEAILKEINFDKTINHKPFTMARKRFATRRGRLFDYDPALAVSRRHGRELDEIFDCVCVEGRRDETGQPRAYWRVKEEYEAPESIK